MTDLEYNFQVEVFKCITKAFEMYNITSIDPEDVAVRIDIRGRCAGQAGYRTVYGERRYFLRFNIEAVEKHWDEQVNSTIPHEVAHLICYLRPELGKNHNSGWRRVAVSLGDKKAGARTHSMELTSAKAKTEYVYNVNGNKVVLGPKRHSKLQKGVATYSHRTYGKITRDMFVKKLTTKPSGATHIAKPVAKPAPARSVGSSSTNSPTKREQAEALYQQLYRDRDRATIINAFMTHVGLTKAGANTYFYNCQKKFG